MMITDQTPGLLPVADLRDRKKGEMFSLLAQHFDGVTRDRFEADLAGKNWVVEIRRDEKLLGFSTILAEEVEVEGREITAIYSGDTIVAPEAWNSPALARNWIAAVNYLRSRRPECPCYWLLITAGFRTYRFLPVFWREFFPSCEVNTPTAQQRLMDRLAQWRYGAAYDAGAGLVRFPQPQFLRPHLCETPPGRHANPNIAYFLARNPGYARGDELVCLTKICESNLTAAGRRMISR